MRLVITLLLTLQYGGLHSQEVFLATQYQTLKGDVWNYIQIGADDESCESLQVISEAQIEKDGECTWKIKPHLEWSYPKAGVMIQPFKIEDSDTVFFEPQYLQVERMDVLISGTPNSVNRTKVLKMENIYAFAKQGQFGCVNTKASSFKVMAIRSEDALFSYYNTTDQISKELKKLFSTLQAGDELYFFDLKQDSKRYSNIKEFNLLIE